VLLGGVVCADDATEHNCQRLLMDFGWKFTKDDPPNSSRLVYAPDAARADFDDSGWRSVDLPHDWSIEGPWAQDNSSGAGGGYDPLGIGWYRKHFKMPEEWMGKHIFLEFDGVFNRADVWVNGEVVGQNDNGYLGFQCDLTPFISTTSSWFPVTIGKDNIIAVRVDNSRQASRWYTGSGLYRHVWLTVTGPLHVAYIGTYITTPVVSDLQATVRVQTTLRNDSDVARSAMLVTELKDPQNNIVAALVAK